MIGYFKYYNAKSDLTFNHSLKVSHSSVPSLTLMKYQNSKVICMNFNQPHMQALNQLIYSQAVPSSSVEGLLLMDSFPIKKLNLC